MFSAIINSLREYFQWLGIFKGQTSDNAIWNIFVKSEKNKEDFLKLIEQKVFSLSSKRILDVGCGKGGALIVASLKGAAGFGLEPDINELNIARLRAAASGLNIDFHQGAGEKMPFADNFFDLVIVNSVLEHVDNFRAVSAEISRVLKPGGFYCLNAPNPRFPKEGHYKVFYPPYLPKIFGTIYLKGRGFNPQFFIQGVHYPYPSVLQIKKCLFENGFTVFNITENDTMAKLEKPSSIGRARLKKIFIVLKWLGLQKPVGFLFCRFKLYPNTIIFARKNIINPANKGLCELDAYEKRSESSPRERYIHHHWRPLIEMFIARYCFQKDVLDLGCGEGAYIDVIKRASRSVEGVDISEQWLERACQKHPGIRFFQADAEELFYENGSFGAVVCLGLMECVNHKKLFSEIKRILRQGGYLILSAPNKYGFSRMVGRIFYRLNNKRYPLCEPSRNKLMRLLCDNGLELLDFRMDDGLFWLPDVFDRLINGRLYILAEKFWKIFPFNPFSNLMVIAARLEGEAYLSFTYSVGFLSLFAYPVFSKQYRSIFGGSEVQLFCLAKALTKYSFVSVNTIVDGGSFQPSQDKIDGVSLWKGNFLKRRFGFMSGLMAYRRIFLTMKKADVDVYVQQGAGLSTGIVSFFCRLLGKKMVFMTGSIIDVDKTYVRTHLLGGLFYRYGLRNADLVITQCQEHKELLKQNYHLDSVVMKNGFPLPENTALPSKEFVLWVASSQPLKQPYLFLDLAKKFPQEKFLMILSKHPQHIYLFNDIQEQAKDITNLTFVSNVPFAEIDIYYQKAKVFVNTSAFEGFPNTFIQAAMYQTPIVSLQVNPDSFLAKWQCGFCANGDWQAMQKHLALLLNNEELRRSFGRNARDYVAKNHNVKDIAEQFERETRKMLIK